MKKKKWKRNLDKIDKELFELIYMFFRVLEENWPAGRFRSLHVGEVDVHVGQVQDLSVQRLNVKNNYGSFYLSVQKENNYESFFD